jgi:site-specific DNA recombinase
MARPRKQDIQERMIRTVAAYVRVSTTEQAENGHGLGAQVSRCRAMAQVKGWPDPVVYADEGVSGTKEPHKRLALTQLLADIEAGKVDAVIIAALDRLGRKTRIVLDMVEELARAGVALVICRESLDTSTPQGQFVLTMFAALAQLERDVIAERTSEALQERGRKYGYRSGRLPYGYIRYKGQEAIEVDHKAAEIVRQIFALRDAGTTLEEIAATLSEYAEPPRGGKRWYASSVNEILKNEAAYRGGRMADSPLRWLIILQQN